MARLSFLVREKIGPKQSITPEGFLLCEEVPIARTGMLVYGPNETPIEVGPEGYVKIFRDPEEVFAEPAVASAQGKPVTDNHPTEDVTPDNWKDLTVGIAMNVRRGDGAMDDLLLADLLITTPDGIEAIKTGKREVSCGYDAEYTQTAPGVGKQSNIVINHIALVDEGRCGPRCAIGDAKPLTEKGNTTMKRSKILDTLLKAFKAKDAEEVEQLAKEVADEMETTASGEPEAIHIHLPESGEATTNDDDAFNEHVAQNAKEHEEMRAAIAALTEKVNALEGAGAAGSAGAGDEDMPEGMMDEMPEGIEKEEAAKSQDSVYFADSFKDTVASAEILVPGIRVPTFDRTSSPKTTLKNITALRKQALDLAYFQPATRAIIDELLGGKVLDTKQMSVADTRTLFRSATSAKKAINNASRDTSGSHQQATKKAGVRSLADLNKLNHERFR